MKFNIGDRVRLTVDAPPAWAGAWSASVGATGTVTHGFDMWGTYGVLLDRDPYRLSASFAENELEAES